MRVQAGQDRVHRTWYVPTAPSVDFVLKDDRLACLFVCASGRSWYLAFSVAGVNTGPPLGTSRAGEWLVSLGLGENRSPTWVDGRLSIVDRSLPPSSTLDPPSVAQRVTHLGLPLPPKHPHSCKQRHLYITRLVVSFTVKLGSGVASLTCDAVNALSSRQFKLERASAFAATPGTHTHHAAFAIEECEYRK